jgi:hypothetical protein
MLFKETEAVYSENHMKQVHSAKCRVFLMWNRLYIQYHLCIKLLSYWVGQGQGQPKITFFYVPVRLVPLMSQFNSSYPYF